MFGDGSLFIVRPNILIPVANIIPPEIKARAGSGVRDSIILPPIPPYIKPKKVLLSGFSKYCSAVLEVVIIEITAVAGIIPSRPNKDTNRVHVVIIINLF